MQSMPRGPFWFLLHKAEGTVQIFLAIAQPGEKPRMKAIEMSFLWVYSAIDQDMVSFYSPIK